MSEALPLPHFVPGAPPEFNVQELLNVASRARGKTCHRDPNDSGRGQFSFTVPISFDDGVEWIAKCPLSNAVKDPEVRRLMVESEVATLQLVRERTTIPVPQVFAWNSSDENPVGTAYLIMSRASGRLLSDCGWYSWLSVDGTEMTLQQKCKIYSQLGQIIHQLSLLRFPKIGSIFRVDHDEGYSVGQCIRIQTVEYGRADRGVPRGPFSAATQYYSMLADVQADEIWDSDLYIGVFFDSFPRMENYARGYKDNDYRKAIDKWNERAERGANTIENKLDRRVFADLLREMIPDMQLVYPDEEGFPLEHADLGTHNIFVDTDFNITCIIDWALCSTVPVPTLLTHPPLPSRSYVLGMPEQQAFEQAFEEKERKMDPNRQLTRLLRSSHERRDFDRFLHKDARVEDYTGFQRLFEWKLGTRNMRDYFAERKERDFLQLRQELINPG